MTALAVVPSEETLRGETNGDTTDNPHPNSTPLHASNTNILNNFPNIEPITLRLVGAPVDTIDDCTPIDTVELSESPNRVPPTDYECNVYLQSDNTLIHGLWVKACGAAEENHSAVEVDNTKDMSNRSIAFSVDTCIYKCPCGFQGSSPITGTHDHEL